MSDDLIRRKELLRKLSSGEFDRCSVIYDSDGFPTHISLVGIKNIIRTMPTAFDKEKVIKELKSKAEISQKRKEFFIEKGFTQDECLLDGKERSYKNAIEIVEKGGA